MRAPIKVMEEALGRPDDWQPDSVPVDPEPPPRDATDTDIVEAELTFTDTGNATRLTQLHGPRLRYVASWGRWLVCGTDGFWTVDRRDVRVRELAKDIGHQLKLEAAQEPDSDRAKKMFTYGLASLNARGISGMVDLARGIEGIPLDHEKLDKDGWLLGVENGVVDLRTGEIRPADPSDLMTMRCPVPYDTEARATRFSSALEEWFPDEEVRAYVHRVTGSVLVGAQHDHVFVIHYGLGGNGPSACAWRRMTSSTSTARTQSRF